jgi:hypothetical protein
MAWRISKNTRKAANNTASVSAARGGDPAEATAMTGWSYTVTLWSSCYWPWFDWHWEPVPFDPNYTDDPEQEKIAFWRSIYGDGWPESYDTDWPRDTR